MIKVLDKIVSDKIAAGEVVERPLSVVKELIENAIDSGADQIVCEIKNGGKTYIRVTDNGCGIPKDEVETAFLRHATSKISQVSDLNSLLTLGFRGEALASIAAVSRVQLVTKERNERTSTELIIHGSNVVSKKDIGSPDGTTIIVSDLFYNTPARLKFLKSDGAETTQIIDFMSQIALAYIDIKFRLISNDRTIFSTNGKGDRLNAIAEIYQGLDTKNLVPVSYEMDKVRVSGYTSTPAMSRPTRNLEVFFVNGRVVESKVIERGLNLGYMQRLFEGRYPVSFLFINAEPDSLDVNIHPNKRQVRFNDDNLIVKTVEIAITEALRTKESVVRFDMPKAAPRIEPEVKQIDIKELLSTEVKEEPFVYESDQIEIARPFTRPFDFDDLTFLGTIFNTYILAQDEDAFYMFDQHACHERINYEKFIGLYNSSEKNTQPIMFPFMVNTNLTGNWMDVLRDMGFKIDEFGQDTYRVTEIPTFMTLSEAENFVIDFLDNLKDNKVLNNKVVIDKLIMKSCKDSVKANDKLTVEEISSLMESLKQCINPFSCPHGRPTFVKMTKYDIEKIFKRV
ncbi:MAG: DNA mismatch repair endonuclease MutL [Clostridia bacterium]|nr:DNA mismatch repair endonuclease MutL [Clostridia bacterium]